MEKIKIACTSGITLPISEMTVYPGKLKKHSQLMFHIEMDYFFLMLQQ